MRFYGGYTLDSLREIEAPDLDLLYRCIDIIEAQETLRLFKVTDWPNLKKDRRDKIYRQLSKIAFPFNKKKAITSTEFARIMRDGRAGR